MTERQVEIIAKLTQVSDLVNEITRLVLLGSYQAARQPVSAFRGFSEDAVTMLTQAQEELSNDIPGVQNEGSSGGLQGPE